MTLLSTAFCHELQFGKSGLSQYVLYRSGFPLELQLEFVNVMGCFSGAGSVRGVCTAGIPL